MDTASDNEEDDGIVINFEGYERLDEEKSEKFEKLNKPPGTAENLVKKKEEKASNEKTKEKPNQVDQYEPVVTLINPINTSKMQVQKNDSKKIKVSLSQEQIKSNMRQTDVKKARSRSFSVDRKPMSIYFPQAAKIKHNLVPTVITQDIFEEDSPKVDVKVDNRILIVPRIEEPKPKNQTLKPMASSVSRLSVLNPNIRTSHTSLASGISGVLSAVSIDIPTLNTSFKPFKYPEELQCKICLNLLKDPRILDCLHSFCLQCLIDMDSFNSHGSNHWRNLSGDVSEFEFGELFNNL